MGTVIIRSHGVAKEVYDISRRNEVLQIVDATCPFVKKIHNIVERESAAGNHIVIIGNPGSSGSAGDSQDGQEKTLLSFRARRKRRNFFRRENDKNLYRLPDDI